jgi:parallel beta-helix repeat protein
VITIPGSIENCVFRSCGNVAVSVVGQQRIVGNNISIAATGILATGAVNVIDGNTIDSCTAAGISVTSGANTAQALVVRNQVRNCTTNFLLDAPCQSGPVIIATGTIASATNSWANFTD